MFNTTRKAFLDSVKLTVAGGQGGNGLPGYGGIGGKGGDVYVQGDAKLDNLRSALKKVKERWIEAGKGRSSKRYELLGANGHDRIIKVPVGVTVEDIESNVILGDIDKPTDKVFVAFGGRGGDKYSDMFGLPGQRRKIRLDLKTISDAAFVGFPNAGKSSLLRAISNAVPKVAEYPFTTLRPYLGVIEFPDYRRIKLADLPGLVEGAHKNIGLGQEFLKHLVRARLLVFLIDINGVDLGPEYQKRNPIESLNILRDEIKLYDDTLLRKPSILLVSKMDTVSNPDDRFNSLMNEIGDDKNSFDDVLAISSKTKLNLTEFKSSVRMVIDKYADEEKFASDQISNFEQLRQSDYNRISK